MSSISKLGSGLFVGATFWLGATTAGATEPAQTASEVQEEADAARARSEELSRVGGPAYKTGAVERASQQAMLLDREAAALRAAELPVQAVLVPVESQELTDAQARLERLRFQGGWAYKTGAVQRAEEDVRRLSEPGPVLILYEVLPAR